MFLMLIMLSSIGNIDLNNTLNFAKTLEKEGDYFRAITEYKRYWFIQKIGLIVLCTGLPAYTYRKICLIMQ